MNDSLDRPSASVPPVMNCWVLTGPTASGKTTIGLELAERLGAEILSLDSMAVYRGLNIGTAKPTAADRARAPHHLLDLVDPHEEFSLSQYVAAAHAAVAEVRGRGRQPLFVGGTPLYLKALLRGVTPGPPPDWEYRREIEAEVARVGSAPLHARLAMLDPLAAAKLHPRDQRRIIRALEVLRTTGQPISHQQTQFDDLPRNLGNRVFALEWNRAELHLRIEARVDAMYAQGLVDETRGVLARHGAFSRTANQAVGYAEALAFLRGELDLAEAILRTKQHTRQFAKRQETWFRSLPECQRITPGTNFSAAQVAQVILE